MPPRLPGSLVEPPFCMGQGDRLCLLAACPRPNLGSGAHAADISEAKGAQPSGRSAAPLRVAPRERESRGGDIDEGGAMTEGKTFKRRVRERMSKTGESYTAARGQVVQKRDRNRAARARLAAADDRVSDAVIQRETGKKWDEWFRLLDGWGAREKKHPEIARYLSEEQGVGNWWAQSVTVGYERDRGMRLKYERPDGFAVSASKTVAVPIDVLFNAFVDERLRKRWLVEGTMSLRTSQPGRSARFDWEDGATRVAVGFVDKGPARSMVAVAHERLPDADEAETMKAWWRERLAELKSFLEEG
jgi:hypothetical protein